MQGRIALTLACVFLLGLAASVFFDGRERPRKLDVSFFLHVEREKSYWVGDLLKFYDRSGNLLALLSKAALTQNALFTNPNTVSLDLTGTSFARTPLKREDFIDLGRPGGNVTYLAWVDGRLVAHSFGKQYCKDTPQAKWENCGTIEYYSQIYPTSLAKLVNWANSLRGRTYLVLVGSSRVLLLAQSGLSDCSVSTDGGFSCEGVRGDPPCSTYVLAYYVIGDTAFLYCSDGDTYHYQLSNKALRRAVAATSFGLSNQFYASYMLGNVFYLGHYPSGGLFQTTGLSLSLAAPPPVRPGYSTRFREVQSIGYIGGKIIVGLWPWGEVWEAPATENSLSFGNVVPLFRPSSIAEDTTKDHPLENILPVPNSYNELGRRVATMVPCWNGICLSTSSKQIEIEPNPYMNEENLKEYGRVYYLRGPKSSCTVELGGDHFVELSLTESGGTLSVDGASACTFSFEDRNARDLIGNVARIEIGSRLGERNGHYGQLRTFSRQ